MSAKETIERLIRNEFDKLTNFWQENEAKNLIITAKSYGLEELAEEMQNDLR